MKIRIAYVLCLTVALVAFGCEDKGGDEPAEEQSAAQEPAESAGDEAEEAGEADEADEADESDGEELAEVDVTKEGSTFDPAVQPEQLPAGVWYCDMGDVHWAGGDKPEDGSCPECGMKLKQHDPEKLAAQKRGAVEAHDHDHDDGHDHDHDDGHSHDHDDGHDHDHGGEEHGHKH